MNRRHFLASAAGALAAPALLRNASADEGPFRVKYFPVPGRPALARRDGVQRRRHHVVQLPGQRQARPARSARRLLQADRPRAGLRAAWRDRRARRRRLGHRRRTERDRAGRQRPQGHGLQAADQGLHQSQHRRVRQDRHLLVHRAERLSRPARSEVRRHHGVQVAGRTRQLRHDRHAERRHLVRLARRQPHRQDRSENRQRHRGRAGHAQPGRAPGVVGLERPHLGQRVEQRQCLGARSGHRLVAHLAPAGPAPAHLLGLCGRQGQGLAHRLRRQRHRALRSGDGKVQRVPERQAERQRAPDGRQARARRGAARAAPTGWS